MSTDVHAKATQHGTERDERYAIAALRMLDRTKVLPDWIIEESVGYNYEHGMSTDEIIGFLTGFMAGVAAEKKRSEGLGKAHRDWETDRKSTRLNSSH